MLSVRQRAVPRPASWGTAALRVTQDGTVEAQSLKLKAGVGVRDAAGLSVWRRPLASEAVDTGGTWHQALRAERAASKGELP